MEISLKAPLEFVSAAQIARAIRGREISSHQVTAHLLRRIDELNPQINAIVTLLAESALARAQQADAALARGECWGPLHGVPCTVKDTFEMAGVRTTAGTEELRDYVPGENSMVVDRLNNAGAIILGKTNTPALGADWQTYNSIFGVTNNPRDLKRTPGGSSGGCAAAIAAGFSYLSVGSDMGGSIRIPAAFCGIYGHKPSLGLIPSKGHIPPLPGKPPSTSGLGVRGPLARNPADLALAMQVLGGPEAADSIAWRWSLPAPRGARISDYRIGFMFDDLACPVSAEVRVVLDSAVEALGRAGAEIEPGWPNSLIPEHQYKVYRYLSLARKGVHSAGGRKAQRLSALVDELDSDATARSWANMKKQLFSAKGASAAARHLWNEYFRTHDAFLLPVAFVPAFPHEHTEPWEDRWLQTSEGPQPYLNLPYWASFATLAGLPVTSAPAGFTPAGLPVGIQIIGPYLEDATAIDLAGRLADLAGGYRAPDILPALAVESALSSQISDESSDPQDSVPPNPLDF